MVPNLPLLGEVRRRLGLGRRNALKPGRGDGGRGRMPHRRDGLRRHHVVRQHPWRVEMRASLVRIEKAPRLGNPAHVPKVLPRIVEWVVPAARTHLIPPLWVRDRAPYPANTGVLRCVEQFRRRDIDAACADVKGELSHIPVYRLYLLRLAILRKTQPSAPRLFSLFLRSTNRLQTDFFYLIAQKFDVAARCLEPRALACLVPRHRDDELYPHLLAPLQAT